MEKLLFGNPDTSDEYFIVENEEGEILIVHEHYFGQENAIIFTLGHKDTDYSENMLMEIAKTVVSFLNGDA